MAKPLIWVVSTQKNEGVNLLEWIAYYRLLGVDRFLVYCNDTDDGSIALYQALARSGWFDWHENPVSGAESPQWRAYQRAFQALNGSGNWALVVDVDEFLYLPRHRDLRSFVDAHDDKDAVSFYWRNFGSGGALRREAGLVIERFFHCADASDPKSTRYKTLTRMGDHWTNFGVHQPHAPEALKPSLNWIDGAGAVMGSPIADAARYDLGAIYHYVLKSAEEYVLKKQRGAALVPENSCYYNDQFFRDHDRADLRDMTMLAWVGPIKAEMARLIQDYDLAPILDAIEADYETRVAVPEPAG